MIWQRLSLMVTSHDIKQTVDQFYNTTSHSFSPFISCSFTLLSQYFFIEKVSICYIFFTHVMNLFIYMSTQNENAIILFHLMMMVYIFMYECSNQCLTCTILHLWYARSHSFFPLHFDTFFQVNSFTKNVMVSQIKQILYIGPLGFP